jgi:hypothetical protein
MKGSLVVMGTEPSDNGRSENDGMHSIARTSSHLRAACASPVAQIPDFRSPRFS